MPLKDAAAVTVPGAVDAFVRLSADWGRLGLAASLTRAMRANLHHRRERDRTVFSLRIRSDPDLVLDTPD